MNKSKLNRRQFIKGAAIAATIPAVCTLKPFYGVLAHAAAPPPLKIGYVSGLTGAIASWAYPGIIVYKYVIDEVNKQGGIKSMGGAKIELLYTDCESDAKKAVTEAEKMLSLKKPHAMLSTVSSGLTKGVLPIVDRYKVPMVGMEYSDELYTMGTKFWFGVMPKVTINAKAIADLFIKTGKQKGQPMKTAAILCQDGSFGEMASDFWGKYLASEGVQVVANEIYPTGKVADFSDTISKFKAKNADALLCSTTPYESALIVRGMKATNFNPLGVAFSCTCIDTPDFLNLGKDADFAFGVPVFSSKAIGNKIKGVSEFLKKFYSVVTDEKERKLCSEKVVLERVFTIAPIIHGFEKAKSYDPLVIRDAIAKLDLQTGERYVVWPDGIKFDDQGWNMRTKTIGGQYQNMELKIFFPESMVEKSDSPVWPMPQWSKR
jgi:branched-chain amino acid transport system substrate-binding protein